MNITFVVSRFRKSGPTTQLRYIVSSLLQCQDVEKVNLKLVTLRAEGDSSDLQLFQSIENVEIFSVQSGLDVAKNIVKIKNSVDSVVISSGLLADLVCWGAAPKSFWMSVVRSFPTEDYKDKFGRVVGYILSVLVVRMLKSAARRIAVSESLKVRLESLGLSVVTARNAVPNAPLNLIMSVPEESRVFLIVGNLRALKNVENGIKLFLSVRNKLDSLYILGEGPLREALESKFGDDELIYFKGYQDNVTTFYAQAACLISLSYSEGMPNSVLEALSWGLPCLLSPIPAHRELEALIPEAIKFVTDEDLKHKIKLLPSEVGLFVDKNLTDRARISKACNSFLGLTRISRDYQNLVREVTNENRN